jgi:CRP-like cAMP-binding protein
MKIMDSFDKIMQTMPTLVPFTARDKRLLSKLLHIRFFAVHEEVYPASSPAVAAYYIIEGSIGVFRINDNNMPERIAYHKPQQWFGYSAFLNDDLRDTSTQALEQTRCLVLFRTDYLNLVEKDSSCALKILTNVCFDLHRTLEEVQKDYFALTRKLARANILV